MTGPPGLIDITAVVKSYGGLRPLRIKNLQIAARDQVAIGGLDAGAAETLINLITGASIPDEGTVKVGGRDTRDIGTDTEWLASLDRFGIVTHRAVLIGKLPVEQNLALPLTLAIDPMSDETRRTVQALAERVGLPRERLAEPASSLTPAELVRVHMARALAPRPEFMMLEHPTAALNDERASESLGRTLHDAADAAGVGWLALTEDAAFVRASGSTSMRLQPASGAVASDETWWKRLIK